MYHLEEGPFAPPMWQASLPVQQRMIEEDCAIKEVQQQWGMAAFALFRVLVCLEAIMVDGSHRASADPSRVDFPFKTLKDEITSQVATPLVRTLCLVGSISMTCPRDITVVWPRVSRLLS